MNKFRPRNVCKCGKVIWCYDDRKELFRCKDCKEKGPKRLYSPEGAILYLDQNKHYVLEFEEEREKGIYPRWEDLQKELDKLAENGKTILAKI